MTITIDFKKTAQKIRKVLPASTFGLSLLFHAILLFLIGGIVLVQGVIPRGDFLSVPYVENPVPDEEPTAAQAEPDPMPNADPAESSPLAAAETTADSNPWVETGVVSTMLPSLQAGPVDGPRSVNGTDSILSGSKTGTGIGKGLVGMGSVFGSKGGGANALTGFLYDLKQGRDRKPTGLAVSAGEGVDDNAPSSIRTREIIRDFVKRWDEEDLKRFYRSKDPLSTYQFFIPPIGAVAAPKAFEVEKEVQPKRWLIHYKGDVTAAVSGRFRFVGLGDDILIVRAQKKTVFDGSWVQIVPEVNSRETNGPFVPGWKTPRLVRMGAWFNVIAGETCSFEVLVGEVPGGQFSTCLLIQQEGKDYQPRPGGEGLIFPVFQTAPTRVPASKPGTFPETETAPFVFGR